MIKYHAFIILLALGLATQRGLAESYSDVPVLLDDVKEVITARVQKYKIDFNETSSMALEVTSSNGVHTYPLRVATNSVVLQFYIVPGPRATDLSTLHFWIGSEGERFYTYTEFHPGLARFTRTGFKNGTFEVVALAAENQPEELGYSLRLLKR